MARILGLDLGSYSVKAVVLEAGRGATGVRSFAEARRPENVDRLESLRHAIRELFAAHPMQFDQVVVGLPGQSLATHPVSLPFTQAKQIEATLPSEVEAQLPFDLSDAVYDYQPSAITEKKTDMLVGLIRRDEMRELLAALTEVGVEPRIVTHPALAYQSLLAQHAAAFGDAAGTVAILDIGHERTSIAIGSPGGAVDFARTFSGGGIGMSKALASEFQTPLAEAHAWKEQHGAFASAVNGPDAERAAAAFLRGLQPVLRELRPSIKAFTARMRRNVDRVYLCGGTARMPGLDEQLSKDLGIPTQLLALPGASAIAREVAPAAAQAFTLATRGTQSGPKAPRFNLRRGEFAFKGDFDFLRERAPRLAAYAAILLVLLIAGGIVRNTVLARREAQVDNVVCEVTRRVLGTCEKNYDRAINMLQGTESPAAAIPRYSAVTLLAELTSRVPREIPVTFDQIIVDLDRITVRGETENNKQIDQIRAALKGFRCFREVNQGRAERTRDGQRVTFRLDVKVDCTADAQAQG